MKITMLGSGSYKSSLSIRLIALGQQLGKQGHDVTLILPAADKYNSFQADYHAKLPNVRLRQPWQLATHSASLNLLPYLATSFLALLASWPDVIYIYKPTPITILGLLLGLVPGKRVVLDLDDLGSEVMREQGQPKPQVSLVALCEHLAIHFSTAVVVTSTYLQKMIQQHAPNKPLLLLANGVEPDEYTPVPARSPRAHIYYFGAVNRLSLVEDLLCATPAIVAAVPNVKISIIGDGSALPEAKKLAKKLGVATNITFPGWVDKAEVQKYTHFADIGVCYQPDIPTVRAASNMKVFQYMAMASVPAVSDVGDLANYVQNGQAGVAIPAGSPDDLAAELIELLKDPAKRTRLAKAAHQLAAHEYSWQHLGQKLANFLSQPTKQEQGRVA